MSGEHLSHKVWNAFTALGASIGVVAVVGTVVTLIVGVNVGPRDIIFSIVNVVYIIGILLGTGLTAVLAFFWFLGSFRPEKTHAGPVALAVLGLVIVGFIAWIIGLFVVVTLDEVLRFFEQSPIFTSAFWRGVAVVSVIMYLAWGIAALRKLSDRYKAAQVLDLSKSRTTQLRSPRSRRGRIIERQRLAAIAAARPRRTLAQAAGAMTLDGEIAHGVRMVMNTLASWRHGKGSDRGPSG